MSTSPILFEIYIDSILKKLNDSGYETYLFADDMAIITNNEKETKESI
jgi:Reverse transcriptase (RNA-dependent DNA polymerase)